MLFLSVLSVAPFMRKGWSWSVVIEAVWVAELKIFTVSPSDRQVRGLPCPGSQCEQTKYSLGKVVAAW